MLRSCDWNEMVSPLVFFPNIDPLGIFPGFLKVCRTGDLPTGGTLQVFCLDFKSLSGCLHM